MAMQWCHPERRERPTTAQVFRGVLAFRHRPISALGWFFRKHRSICTAYNPYLRCSFRMHLSITTITPACRAFSAAASCTTFLQPECRNLQGEHLIHDCRHRLGATEDIHDVDLSTFAASLNEGYAFSPSTSLSFGLIGTTRYPLLCKYEGSHNSACPRHLTAPPRRSSLPSATVPIRGLPRSSPGGSVYLPLHLLPVCLHCHFAHRLVHVLIHRQCPHIFHQ